MKRILLLALWMAMSSLYCLGQNASITKLKKKASQSNDPAVYNQVATLLLPNNIKEAKEYATNALEVAAAANNLEQQAIASETLGKVAQQRFDYTNAIRYYLADHNHWRAADNAVGVAMTNLAVGEVYTIEDEIKQSLTYLNQANSALEKAGKRKELAVYYKQNFVGKAKASYEEAMNLYVEQEAYKEGAGIARFLGMLSLNLGEYDGANTYFSQSLDLHGALEDLPNIAKDYNNIALTNLAQKNFEEAAETNKIALDLRTEIKDTFGLAESYKNIGLIAIGQNNKEIASKNFDLSTTLVKQIKAKKGVPELYEDIEQGYFSLGKYKQAYQSQSAGMASIQELSKIEKARALYELTVRHSSELEVEEKENTIALLEKDKVASSRLKWFLFAVIGLIASTLGMLFVNFQRKKKANKVLKDKNTEIQWQKGEIDRQNIQLEEKAASLDLLNTKLVDEMAERESMEKSSFARDSFLAMMSHEMRTPINIIVGLTHLLLEDNPHDSQKEALRKLQFSANNLVVFINDVLDYSKIEAGKLVMQNRSFEVSKVIEEVKNWSSAQAKEKKVDLNFTIDPKIPAQLIGDPVRLNQIITDLISNALNYTEDGHINTTVNLHQLNDKDLTLLIQIDDNGKGIEQDKLEEMFKNFTRDPNADLYDGASTSGLELAITKRLVDLQNGKIEVDSQLGKGSTFKLFLPFKASDSSIKSTGEEKVLSYNFMVGKKVLVVEDNKINQLVVKKMLLKIGMKVTTANDGLQALDAIRNNNFFDLILMDIQMPNLDGYRTTAEIRKNQNPKISEVPIIALTASAYLSEKEKAQLFGMDDHVGKPFGPDELMEKISLCLSKKTKRTSKRIAAN